MDPHPITCPRCGGVLGHEDDAGCLHTAIGIVAHVEMIHPCGQVVYWHANMRRLGRLIERASKFTG